MSEAGRPNNVVVHKHWGLTKSYPLVKSIRSALQRHSTERNPEEIVRLVEEMGFENAFAHALLYAYMPSWNNVARKFRAIGHLMRSADRDFLECWLQVSENKDDVLVALYERNQSFVHSVWKCGVGTISMQVEVDGIVCFDADQHRIVCANRRSVWVFSMETGKMLHTFLLDGVTQIQCVEHGVYLSNPVGIFLWNGASLSSIWKEPVLEMHAYAEWLAFQDTSYRVHLLHETIDCQLPEAISILRFCHRGLAMAMGTDSGHIYLYKENLGVETIKIPVQVGISALFWDSAQSLWIGDEEGGIWFWEGTECVRCNHLGARILSIGYHQEELIVVSARGHVWQGSKMGFLSECFAAVVHDTEGIICSIPHNRCCIVRPESKDVIENVFWVEYALWGFGGNVEALNIEGVQTRWFPSSAVPFVYVDAEYALDNRGSLWVLEDGVWNLQHKNDVGDIQKSWIYEGKIWLQTQQDVFCLGMDGRGLVQYKDVLLSSQDGLWQLNGRGEITKGGYFVRGDFSDAVYMCVYGDMLIVARGRKVMGFDEEQILLERDYPAGILCMSNLGNLIVIGLSNRMVDLLDIDTMMSIGRYRVDGSIVSLELGRNQHILVRMEGGGLEVLMIDGRTR